MQQGYSLLHLSNFALKGIEVCPKRNKAVASCTYQISPQDATNLLLNAATFTLKEHFISL